MPAPCRKTTAGSAGSKSRPPVPTNVSEPSMSRRMVLTLLRGAQRLPEIVNDIVRSLQAHRETHQFLADAGGGKRRGVHLLMRGARRMDDQRLGVADIGEMTCEPHRFDEFASGGAPALDAEADDRSGALRQQFLRQRMIRMCFQRRMQ